jgi:hypothetical protein
MSWGAPEAHLLAGCNGYYKRADYLLLGEQIQRVQKKDSQK